MTNATSKKTIGYDGFTYNLGIEKTYINGVLKERMTYGYELNEKGDWIVERAYKNGFPAFVTERTYN